MKRIIATARVRGQDDMRYVTHVKSDVKAHHDFVRFRRALRKLAERLEDGIFIAYDNTVTISWDLRVDFVFEIEDVVLPV